MASIDSDIKMKITGDVSDINSKLDQVGQKAKQTGDKAKAAGDAGKQGMDKLGQGADVAKIKMGATVIAIQGFTAQIAGMGAMILDFRTKLITLDKTIVGLQSQELALTRMQEDLNKAVEEGSITQRDYERALQDIQLQYKNVILETQNVEAETHKLKGEYVSFGIQVVSMASQVGIAMVALGVTSTKVMGAMVAGIGAVRGALTFLAAHPILIGFTLAMIAWEANILNVRTALEEAFGTGSLSLIENLNMAIDDMTKSSMPQLNEEAIKVTNNLKEWDGAAFKAANSTDELSKSANKAADSYGRLTHEMERAIRISGNSSNVGFRSGGGTSLAESLNRQADEITVALSRTLAAASLHKALEESGLDNGDVRGINISGNNNPALAAFIAGQGGSGAGIFGPDSGFGPSGTGAFGAESSFTMGNGLSLAEQFFRGPKNNTRVNIDGLVNRLQGGVSLGGSGTNSTSNFAGRSLTRSGTLSKNKGSGRGKRRGGRNRNVFGRNDKISQKMRKGMIKWRSELNEEFGFDAVDFAMTGSFGEPTRRAGRFGNNSPLSSSEKRNIILQRNYLDVQIRREAETRRRIAGFNRTTAGASMEEGLALLNIGFGFQRNSAFDPSDALFTQMQDTIQARNFFRKTNVNFDGMEKSGVAGLLNIKEFGYRELNEQLAFQGEEQYMTVGT